MAKKQSQIDKVTQLKDQASAKFEKAVTASEKKIFDEAVALIRELETTPDGKIKASVANLKRLAQIRTKLAKVANNKEYLKAVKELAGEFDAIYQAQAQYFSTLTNQMHHESKYATMKQLAVENTVGGLSGAGLQANVTDKLNDMLLRAVTSGAKYADLIEEMRTYLKGDGEHPGALTRYASTYTVTALSQYAGQNNKLLTDDLGCEWFEYVGSEIETTREFCDHLCDKRYIHKSEIPEILKGRIDGHKCKIYAKTGLPYGLIEGTTPENFQVNVGGWNCRHQLVPIAKEAVPPEIRARFEKPKEEPQQQTTSKDWEEFMKQYGSYAEMLIKWNKNGFTEVETATLEDRTAKFETLQQAYFAAFAKRTQLIMPLFDLQSKLERLEKKATKAGEEAIAAKAKKAVEDNKIVGVPESRADLQRRINNLQNTIDEIKQALTGATPKAPKPEGPKVQTKEVTMATVRINNLMPAKTILEKQIKFVQRTLNATAEEAERYMDALDGYTSDDYSDIRSVQMGDTDDPRYKKMASDLEEFIEKAPKWAGGTTYRGIGLFPDWGGTDIAAFQTAMATRTPIEMYGSASWSTDKGTAKYFAERDGDIHVVFICKEGQPQGTSIAGLSRHPGESEIVTSNKARWLVEKILQPNPKDKTYYEIEVTPC